VLGCGAAHAQTPGAAPAADPIPTTAEIAAFLQGNWPRFEGRFGRMASRPGESAQLISVQNLLCVRYEGVSECSFDLTVRYASHVDVTRRLWDGFNFDDQGKVGEVSIIINDMPSR
jgi:hypothetical protein